MTGVLYSRTSVEGWLRDGTPWERVVLPSLVPHYRGYDPPHYELHRTPDAWWAYQDQLRRWVFGGGEYPH